MAQLIGTRDEAAARLLRLCRLAPISHLGVDREAAGRRR